MKFIHTLVMKSVIALLVSSCSNTRIPMTQQLRDNHQLSAEELKSIQFYVSNDLKLTRADLESKKETTDGELVLLKDAKVEEILFKAGTQCIIKEVLDGNNVKVQFEQGTHRLLVFGSLKNNDGYYTLQAFDWKNGSGKVNYGEKIYSTSKGSRDVFLVLKMKSLEKFKVDQKVVKGQKVN